MKGIYTLAQLTKIAISVDKGNYMRVKYPSGNIELYAPTIDVEDKCYDCQKGIIAFVYNKKLYFIPRTRKILRILHKNNFSQTTLCTPFFLGGTPLDFSDKWNQLLKEAQDYAYTDFNIFCNMWSDKMNYKPLSKELLRTCLEIPKDGIKVKDSYYTDFRPILSPYCLDLAIMNTLGKYHIHKDTCVFIYRNGKTYVTPNMDVVTVLKESGYYPKPLLVPLSNGESIVDPVIAKRWKKLVENFHFSE